MRDVLSAAELARAAETVVIALAAAGDPAAFTEIVRRRQERVRNFMGYLCNHRSEADDLAQQVFLNTWRSIRQLRSSSGFDAWLKRIMITTWLEQQRRRTLPTAGGLDLEDLRRYEESPGERIDLDGALAQLPEAMRLCVVLAYHEGMTHDEIAAATSLPLGTVKSNVSRGAARLRDRLSAYERRVKE